MAAKMPSLAPLLGAQLMCYQCTNLMRPVVTKIAGHIQKMVHYCDTCEYGFSLSLTHANGEFGKYVSPETDSGKERNGGR